jgi:uncharacterized protein (UPF0276 family)
VKDSQLNGTGIGFRMEHADEILLRNPIIPWFEILIDNYMSENAPLSVIDKLIENYPISFHGVGLSIGSIEPIDYRYLAKLRELKNRWQPKLISDHFAWTHTAKHKFHELLPVVLDVKNMNYLSDKICRVQDFIGEQILMENASTYIEAPAEMNEWDFINQICSASGCGLLLDVNNIHVNAFNHKFNATEYIEGIDLSNVKEIHIAGYEDRGNYYFDSHSQPVAKEVWDSFERVLGKIPEIPTLLEWDNDLPELNVLIKEVEKAEKIRCSVTPSSTEELIAI